MTLQNSLHASGGIQWAVSKIILHTLSDKTYEYVIQRNLFQKEEYQRPEHLSISELFPFNMDRP